MAGPTVGYASLQIIPSVRGLRVGLAKQITGDVDQAGKDAGSRFGQAFGAASKVALGGALAGIGAIAGLAKVGSSFDDAFDTIRVGTGATGEALGGLEQSFRNVFSSIPTEMGPASQAIADLNTRLGLTGEPLEQLSRQVIELSRITGTDLGANIEAVTRVFGDWGVAADDQAGALDALFRASQATGITVDQLGQQMVQFGAPLRQMGFDFETTAGLLGKFEKEGVNGELVMGSLRIALGKFARDGRKPAEALEWVTDAIQNAGDAGEANALAMEVFGAKAGPDMAAAIREGRFDLGELYSTISDGSETILGAADDTNDWQQSWERLRNQTLVLIEPLATRVFEALAVGMDWIAERAPGFVAWFEERIWPALSKAGEVIGGAISTGFGVLRQWWDDNGSTIVEGLQSIGTTGLAAISDWWDEHGETVKSGIKAIGDFVNDPVIPAFETLFTTVKDDVLPKLQELIDFIKANEYVLVGLGATISTVVVVAFGAWAKAAGLATIATAKAAIAAALAFAPIVLAAVAVGIIAAALWYAWENWEWFRAGVMGAYLWVGFMVDKLGDLLELLQGVADWLGRVAEKISDLPGLPGWVSGGLDTRSGGGGWLGAFPPWMTPGFDSGGVMPGPRGVHNLAWVAGGETILPTHKDDFDLGQFAGGGRPLEVNFNEVGDVDAGMVISSLAWVTARR